MASRLFAPASSERVDNSVSEVKDQDNADNEPTKRRSSSLVGDLAASILGADVLSARKAPPPFPDAEDASDGTRYFSRAAAEAQKYRRSGEPGGRNGTCAGPGGPDDRRSVAVQLQLSPNGGRRRARLRDAATGTSGRNRRPSLAGRRSAAIRRAASRRGGSRGLTDGQKVETA